MKKAMFLLICILTLLSHLNAQYGPFEAPRQIYMPEQWYRDPYPYSGFSVYPDSGVSAYCNLVRSEPVDCYPMHSGLVRGISDTVEVFVYLQCHDTSNFNLGSYNPEDWFMPALWEESKDPTVFKHLADTSQLDYRFVSWLAGMNGVPVNKPSALKKNRGKPLGVLVYNVWNLPLGRWRLLMIETEDKPSSVDILLGYVRPIWVINPSSLSDTLNAYGACFWRSFRMKNLNAAASWVDSMMKYNQYSIPAYKLESAVQKSLNDSLLLLGALDSTIAIMERFGDPALKDTSYWIYTDWEWYNAMLKKTKFGRQQLLKPNYGKKRF